MKVKIEELEEKVRALDFMVYCIIMRKVYSYSWIKPVILDREGRLIDVTVNALAERIGCKAEWSGPKTCETMCIKVPHWQKYSFDGCTLTHLILQHMYPEFEEKQMDVREFCREL